MILLVFLFIFSILFLAIITSKIEVEIKNLKYKFINETNVDNKYKIKIKLLGFGKIPLLWLEINEKKIEKLKNSKGFKNINLDKIKSKFDLRWENLQGGYTLGRSFYQGN